MSSKQGHKSRVTRFLEALCEPTSVAATASEGADKLLRVYGNHLASNGPVWIQHGLENTPPFVPPGGLPPIPITPGLDDILRPVSGLPDWTYPIFHFFADQGVFLAHILHDISLCITPLSFAMPVCRLLNWYFLNNKLPENVNKICKESEIVWVFDRPTEMSVTYAPLTPIAKHIAATKPVALDLPTHHRTVMESAIRVGMVKGSADNIHSALTNDLGRVLRDLNGRPIVNIPANAGVGFEQLMASRFPEYNFQRATSHHPHPEPFMARKVLVSCAYAEMARIGKPVVAVSASPLQAAQMPNAVHNHCPRLTGRDKYRMECEYPQHLITHNEKMSCKCTLQECPQRFPGTTLFVPLSAPDICAKDVIASMIKNKQSDALVITHVPLPFTDKRIKNWEDSDLNVRFEEREGKMRMMMKGAASAGYVNKTDQIMSWGRSMPIFPGYNVTLEELRSVGSMFLLHLKVTEGKQEEYPALWEMSQGRFYILPILKPDWLFHEDEDKHFCTSADRFDNVVKFAAMSYLTQQDYGVIAGKVKGMEAVISVANQVIMPRWNLTSDEFNSVVTHAMIKAQMMRNDSVIAFERGTGFVWEWYTRMNGNWFGRWYTYVVDNITFRPIRGNRGMFDRTSYERILDKLCARYTREGKFDDPYGAHGRYRVWHGEKPGMLDGLMLDGLKLEVGIREASKTKRGYAVKEEAPKASFEIKIDPPAQPHDKRLFLAAVVETKCQGSSGVKTKAGPGNAPPTLVETPAAVISVERTPTEELYDQVSSEPSCQSGSSESDSTLKEDERLPNFDQPGILYQVAEHALENRLVHKGKINFEGPISYSDGPDPTPCQEDFSAHYASKADVVNAVMASEHVVIPSPDVGAKELVRLIVGSQLGKVKRLDVDTTQLAADQLRSAMKNIKEEDAESLGGLRDLINSFFQEVAKSKQAYRKPKLAINGLPASAKSTLARLYAEDKNTLVVVPSKKLAREWRGLTAGKNFTITTQHRLPTYRKFELLIIDEVNLLTADHVKCWLTLAHNWRIQDTICLGDQFQRNKREYGDTSFGHQPLDVPTLVMRNSLAMPLDALVAFLSINGLQNSGQYRTLSPVRRSVVITNREHPSAKDFPGWELYTRSRLTAEELLDAHGRVMPSVTQAQGTRAEEHYFSPGLTTRNVRWFQEMLAIQSVMFTRHTKRLVVDMPSSDFTQAFPNVPIEVLPVIDGKAMSKVLRDRAKRPYDLDEIFLAYTADPTDPRVNHAAVDLAHSRLGGERIVSINEYPDLTSLETHDGLMPITSLTLAEEVIRPRAQAPSRRLFKEDLPMILGDVYGLKTMGKDVGFGRDPKLRTHVEGAFNLGDIQMSRDTHNDLKNMALRQLNEPKNLHITPQDVQDARELLGLYAKAFMKSEHQMRLIADMGYEYLSTRTNAFVRNWNDAFGENARSLSRQAFLKSQMKYKPGMARKPEVAEVGIETHGQTVIANQPGMTNFFGPYARLGYLGMALTDREDFITDAGFSDKELSRLMLDRGIAARIEGGGNMQIDLTRQDSTHRPAHVIAYCMFLEFCGVPKGVADLYLIMRSQAYVRSMAPNLYSANINWNLGSGDPFTLNANCFMMKSSVAAYFDGMEFCSGIQKGDDFICSRTGYSRSNRGALCARVKVVMKIDEDLPPYHAGRFIVNGMLLADPVRTFMRHFTKLDDPGVSIEDLYQSFVDRNVNYTYEQAEYLKATIPLFYPDVTGEEAVYIVDTICSLRSFKQFKRTYKHSNRYENDIFDPKTDCAYQVAKALKPGLSHSVLKQFRNIQSPEELKRRYERYGIQCRLAMLPCLVDPDFVGAIICPGHVRAKMRKTPRTL